MPRIILGYVNFSHIEKPISNGLIYHLEHHPYAMLLNPISNTPVSVSNEEISLIRKWINKINPYLLLIEIPDEQGEAVFSVLTEARKCEQEQLDEQKLIENDRKAREEKKKANKELREKNKIQKMKAELAKLESKEKDQ